MSKVFGIVNLIISFIVCAFVPTTYSYEYSILCVILYGVFVLEYLFFKKKENYLDFDCLFFVSYFFVTLYYPAFMYEQDPFRYVMYELGFDKDTMSLSSGLALLGISAYMAGSLFITKGTKKELDKDFDNHPTKKIKTTWIFLTAIILVILYVATGGYMKLFNEYVGGGAEDISEGGIGTYFYAFFPAFLFAGIIAEFYNLKIINKKKVSFLSINKWGFTITVVVFLMFFIAGSRTIPIQIVLLILGLYTFLYKPFGLLKFLASISIGFIVLAVVGFLRAKSNEGKEFYMEDAAMDLIINNRNSFLAVERVENYGINFGESMLSPILAPFPFSQSAVIGIFGLNEDDMRSALVFTKDTFGYVSNWGLGTNIMADVYISFGMVGVIIFFILLGYFVNFSMKKAHTSLPYFILYSIFISYAVYLARAEYFYFVRYFVWAYCIIIFSLKFQKLKQS